MTVEIATLETRALFGAGAFAYADPGLDGRLSSLGFSVFAHRARSAAPSFSFSVPLPDAEQGSSSFFVPSPAPAFFSSDFRPAGTASLFVPAQLSWLAGTLISCRYEASRGFSGDSVSLRAVAKQGAASVEDLFSISCRCEARHYFRGGLVLPAITVYGLMPAITAVVSEPRRNRALRPRSDSRLSVRPVYFNFRRALRL